MARAILLVIDSFGIGASDDAPQFGDAQANTFGHIHEFRQQRQHPLRLPNLHRLGLMLAATASSGVRYADIDYEQPIHGAYGYAVEKSFGKDTPSGHWEMAGVPVLFDWGTYTTFPDALIQAFISQAQLPGILGNKHASGTEIIQEYGEQHIRTGKPIVYTSADSVFQIAAHEQHFGLEKLYHCCQIARKLVDDYNIGRVIARPFITEGKQFKRTANRKDYATPPPKPTLLDHCLDAGIKVTAIGKVADIFAHRGISETLKADSDMALFDKTLQAITQNETAHFIFSNFVDFDSVYGHRRDVRGYANALEAFDNRLPELQSVLKPDDIVIISADHGCDPTLPGSDHTREHIPIIAFGSTIKPGFIGRRETFADIGQSLAQHLSINALDNGVSFI